MAIIYLEKPELDSMRKRIPKDVYCTPLELAQASVRYVADRYFHQGDPRDALDPGAGRGVWAKALRDRYPFVNITGVDIRKLKPRPGYYRWYAQFDYLTGTVSPDTEFGFDLIIGNPPFLLAEKFVRRSRELLSPEGVLCFLMPSDFLHGQSRARGLFKEYTPDRVVALAQRPQFTGPRGESLGDRNTDTYNLIIWRQSSNANPPALDWLDWKKFNDPNSN